jgi:hypothetical protein
MAACTTTSGGGETSNDGGATSNDASVSDAGAVDSGPGDAGTVDSGPSDAGASDASVTGTAALDVSDLPDGSFSYTQGTYIESFEFKANSAINVTALGYYDSNLTGTAQTFTATDVGMYDMTTNTLLGSVTVQPSAPAITIFRYAPLATPLALNTTDTYAVVAVTGSDYYVSGYNYGGQLNAALTWIGFAGYGSDNLNNTSVLVEPDFFWTTTGNIGANFLFETN